MVYFYSAAAPRSRGALWTIFAPAFSSPAVRYQIASRAANFHAQDREFYWKFVDERLEAEKSPAVFSALIRSVVFPNVALAEPDRVVDRLADPLQQWLPGKKTKDIVRDSIDCLTQLYVFLDNAKAHEVLASYLGDPRHSADQLNQIAFSSAYFLLQGLPGGTSNDSAIRRRARATILDVLTAADTEILEILDSLRTSGSAEKEALQQTLQSLLHVIETVGFRLYLNLDISPDLRAFGN